ncbi:hypothetical protein BH18THE1_BH18THE1_19450 [soil metagenome]
MNVQFVAFRHYRDPVDTMESMVSILYDNVRIVESSSDKYLINNKIAPYVIATYTQPEPLGYDIDLVLMNIAINLEGNDTISAQYIAEENKFDRHLDEVEKIFQSIKPIN